jgi:hypothetical protein
MKQAQQMQQQLERELAQLEVEATAGGGAVKARVSGQKRLLKLELDPEVFQPPDPEMVAELVVAAVNEAMRKVDETVEKRLGGLMRPGFP